MGLGGVSSTHRPPLRGWGVSPTARPPLPPGKTRYPLYRRLGGPQGRSGRAENLVPTRIRSRTVQLVAQSLYRLSYPAHPHHITVYSSPHTCHITSPIPPPPPIVTLTISNENYKSFSSSVCIFIKTRITSSILDPIIFFSTPFSTTLSLYSSIHVTYQVSQPYTTGTLYAYFRMCQCLWFL